MSNENIPFYVLPFFAVSKVNEYSRELAKVVQKCNEFYRGFIESNPYFYSNGQVNINPFFFINKISIFIKITIRL
jgi:hypothetical protein